MGRVLIIEIGMYSTRVCEAVMGLKPRIYRCICFDTPENAVEDSYIRDKAAMAAKLQLELQKAGIKTREVIYTVNSTKIANREIVIPPVKKERIQQILQANAQDYFPVDLREYTLSYSILEKKTTGEEKGWRLMALAVPDNLIKNYYSFSENMGFRIKNIDYTGNSAFQILKQQYTGQVTLSLLLNEQTTMIYIIEQGVLSLLRTIPYGMLMLEEEMKLSEQAREEAAATEEGLQAAGQGTTEAVDYLLGNLLRVMDFYHTRNEGRPIELILLAGQGAKIPGIAELISEETHLTVKPLEKPTAIRFGKQEIENTIDYTVYCACMGALLKPIRLQSKEQAARQSRKTFLSGGKTILALSVLLAFVMVGVSLWQLNRERSEERRLSEAISSLSPVWELYEETSQLEQKHKAYKEAYQLTETETEQLSQLLSELEEKLPTTVMVDYISVDKEQLSMTMRARNKLSTAMLLMQLKEIELLSEVSLPSMTKTVDEGGSELWSYSLTAKFAKEAVNEEMETE